MCNDPVFKRKWKTFIANVAYLDPAATKEMLYKEAGLYKTGAKDRREKVIGRHPGRE
jgi:hypothetical protein